MTGSPRHESLLKESPNKCQHLVESLSVFIYYWDQASQYVQWAYCKTVRHSSSQHAHRDIVVTAMLYH